MHVSVVLLMQEVYTEARPKSAVPTSIINLEKGKRILL